MESKKSIGQQLKDYRLDAGLTQSQLYAISGISTFTISGLETNNITSVSTDIIKKLQDALDIKFEI